jgi:uncharacterized LabA/DUF88 family protein
MRRGILFKMDAHKGTNPRPKVTRPSSLRVVTFIDAQNLFNQAKRCWRYSFPNYDPILLSEKIGVSYPNRVLTNVRLYTGVPKPGKDRERYWFWKNKIKEHSKDPRFYAFETPLAYGMEKVPVEDPNTGKITLQAAEIAREKGTDVQIGIDLFKLAAANQYDVAVLFSQDRDLAGAINSVIGIKNQTGRLIYLECAFPVDPALPRHYRRGVPNTKWVPINKTDYDACIDRNYYRPPPPPNLFSP